MSRVLDHCAATAETNSQHLADKVHSSQSVTFHLIILVFVGGLHSVALVRVEVGDSSLPIEACHRFGEKEDSKLS